MILALACTTGLHCFSRIYSDHDSVDGIAVDLLACPQFALCLPQVASSEPSLLGRFITSTSTSTSFQLRNRSTHIDRESQSQLVLKAAVQHEFLSKSRTEQNEFGIDNIGKNKCEIHKQLPR